MCLLHSDGKGPIYAELGNCFNKHIYKFRTEAIQSLRHTEYSKNWTNNTGKMPSSNGCHRPALGDFIVTDNSTKSTLKYVPLQPCSHHNLYLKGMAFLLSKFYLFFRFYLDPTFL